MIEEGLQILEKINHGEIEILIIIEEIIEVDEEIEILGVEVGVEIGPDLNSKIEGHLIDQEVEALHNLLDLKHRRIGDVTTAMKLGTLLLNVRISKNL